MGVNARPVLTIACQRDKPRRRTTWPYRDPADGRATEPAGLRDLPAKRQDLANPPPATGSPRPHAARRICSPANTLPLPYLRYAQKCRKEIPPWP
jgi:hypothetical protein